MNKFEQRRKELKLSQRALAELVGCSSATIRKYEIRWPIPFGTDNYVKALEVLGLDKEADNALKEEVIYRIDSYLFKDDSYGTLALRSRLKSYIAHFDKEPVPDRKELAKLIRTKLSNSEDCLNDMRKFLEITQV